MIKKILFFLLQEKKSFIILVSVFFITSLLETLGVLSILPFVAVLSNPKLIETNNFLNILYQKTVLIGITDEIKFIIFLGFSSFFGIIISIIFRISSIYLIGRFSFKTESSISAKLMENYLHQPYVWFLDKNSSNVSKTILTEVNHVIHGALVPAINLLSHSLLTFFLFLTLFFINPILTLVITFVLSISYALIYYLTRHYLFRLGTERLKSNTNRFSILNEAFGAFKAIKISGLEEIYIKNYRKSAHQYAKTQSISQIFIFTPRFILEGVAFGAAILIVILLINQGKSFTSIVPILSIYVFAGYRLIPSLQQIYAALSQLHFSKESLNILYKDFKSFTYFESSSSKIEPMIFAKNIKLNNICYHYPNSRKFTLKNINIIIPINHKIGIVGITGSGKTTLVDVIIGLINPEKGIISVDDNLINDSNKRSWQKNIGYVPQQIYLADKSIKNNIAFGINSDEINLEQVKLAAKISNLHEFVMSELPENYNTIVGERGVRLSGGQIQRIGIARALYHNPQLIIFDEATSSLDNFTEKVIMEAVDNLNNKNVTIIHIAHRLDSLKNCNKIYLLNEGKIEDQGSYNELVQFSEKFNKIK
jgi:ABC-type multidrug transport system fused ATPase/permease subunit